MRRGRVPSSSFTPVSWRPHVQAPDRPPALPAPAADAAAGKMESAGAPMDQENTPEAADARPGGHSTEVDGAFHACRVTSITGPPVWPCSSLSHVQIHLDTHRKIVVTPCHHLTDAITIGTL